MRAPVWMLGIVGSAGACFVDPGTATVGTTVAAESGAGSSTGAVETGAVVTTGEPGTSTSTETGETSGTTTAAVVTTGAGSGSETGTGEASTGEASTGGTSTGGVELPVPGCEALFFHDFTEDPQEALELVGLWNWNEKKGTLTVTTQNGESSMASPPGTWADVVVYARVQVTSGTAVVRARHAAKTNYFGSMQPWTDKLQLGRNLNGQGTVFQSPSARLDANVWYTLTLAVQGNELSFGIDDQVLAMAKDGLLMSGRVGVGGFGTGVAEVDWLLVCAAD